MAPKYTKHNLRLPAMALLALLLLTLLAFPAAAQNAGPQLTVTTDALNVRSGPGTTYSIIGALKLNDTATVIGRNAAGDWWQVRLASGATGWVSGAYTSVSGSTTSVQVVTAPAAQAAPASTGAGAARAAGGTIVFQTTSGGDIYAVNSNGTGLRRLTSGIDPALSPDGTKVAFTRWQNSQNGAFGSLWVINVDGTGERQVAGDLRQPKSPTWSPDGTRIVVNRQQGGWLGPHQACASNPPPDAYDYFFQNGKLCFTLPADPWWALRLVNVSDGSGQDLVSDSHSFSPSWDLAVPWRVVYAGSRGLVNVDVNQNDTWKLTNDLADRSPAVSRDGTRIAVAYRQDDHWEIHVMNSDGSGRVRLTDTPADVRANAILKGTTFRSWNNTAPAWSPDGKQIAFVTDRTGAWELWAMNADGSNQHALLPASALQGINLQYNSVDERMLSWR